MCHYDEVVRSVVGSAAGRLTARRRWFQSARYRGARDAGGEGGVNDDAAQRGRGKGKAMIAPGSPPA